MIALEAGRINNVRLSKELYQCADMEGRRSALKKIA